MSSCQCFSRLVSTSFSLWKALLFLLPCSTCLPPHYPLKDCTQRYLQFFKVCLRKHLMKIIKIERNVSVQLGIHLTAQIQFQHIYDHTYQPWPCAVGVKIKHLHLHSAEQSSEIFFLSRTPTQLLWLQEESHKTLFLFLFSLCIYFAIQTNDCTVTGS